MHAVIYRVRATEGHGLSEGLFKELVIEIPSVGEYRTVKLPTTDLPGVTAIKPLHDTHLAGVIVEGVTRGFHMGDDSDDLMAPFDGTIADCRWA